MAQKRKGGRFVEPIFVGAPTDVDVDTVVAEAVYKGESIARDRSDIVHDSEASVFAWFSSSQATGDIEAIGQVKLGVMEKPLRLTSPATLFSRLY